MDTRFSRRKFIENSLKASALVGFPTLIPASVLGKNGAVAPSNRVNVALLSCGAQSRAAAAYQRYEKSQILAVCDPIKQRRVDRAKEWGVESHYNDFREVLARSDIDAVHISTADHWHVPMSLAAARAGKDVYCEKPLGLSIEQDLAARKIVDEYGRVFQYGTQQRSTATCRKGIELVLNGHIGEVTKIYVWAPAGVAGGSATPVLDVPDGFDYDLWLGPAPEKPFCFDRCLSTEYSKKAVWFAYDYAIGFAAGWGAHPLDQLQWWADAEGMGIPESYEASGVLPTEGLFDTVTHWDMTAQYSGGLEVRFMDSDTAKKSESEIPVPNAAELPSNCTLFMGTEGWVAVSRGTLNTSREDLRRKAKDPGPIRLAESRNHCHNLVDSVLSRAQPVSDVNTAIQSDIVSHMTDLCIRTGKRLKWDAKKQTVKGSSLAKKMMHRPMRDPWTL